MNFITRYISEDLIQALGWTLLHSLWQGAIIGILVAITMILLHKHSAKVRYFVNGFRKLRDDDLAAGSYHLYKRISSG